jgi:hypothetical protein
MSAISPQNLTYQNRTVYLTPAEVKGSAIAAAIDFTQLIPGGDFKTQDTALASLIAQASAEADQYCLGAVGTLGATVNTESGRYRTNRQGQIIVHPAFWPILEVQTFAVGTAPGMTTSLTVTNSNCWVEQRSFVMTATADSWSSQGPVDLSALGYKTGDLQFVQYTYVNGYFCQYLSAPVAAGATSITVPSTTGLYAGQPFTIYDGALSESAMVSSSWDGTSTTVPLVSALTYAHGAGTNATTLPPTVKEAVIHLVVAKVKARGQGGFVLNEIGEPTMVSGRTETSYEDHRIGLELLAAFKQVMGRS